ncbi:MAG: enoyl-CoA hydratase/isomerase family protein, partial [Candidatus Acidiferrales bacterium]
MLALENVRVRTEGRIARIMLDRPPLNVMNIAMMREISAVIEELGPEMDFLVFQGAGEKGFSAGAEVADHTPEHVTDMLHAFHGIFREIGNGRFITIATVHGYCLGGGCELATFCDFVVATESAKFGQPEIKLGCFPPVAM